MSLSKSMFVAAAALSAALAQVPAHADAVHWTVAINAPLGPGVSVGTVFSNGRPVLAAPAPVYVEPVPVVVAPAPVYVPAPVAVRPAPIYAPAPVVVAVPPQRVIYRPVPQPVPVVVWERRDPRGHWHRPAPAWREARWVDHRGHRHDDRDEGHGSRSDGWHR